MLGELPILIPFAFALREEDTGTDAVSRKFSLQVEGIQCSRKRVKNPLLYVLHVMNRCLWWRFVIESRCESRFLMENHLLLVAVEFVTSKVGHNGWRQAGRALAFCPLFFMGEIYKSKSFRNEARISLWPSAILFSNPGEFWMWVFSLRQEFEILSHKELV